jgi:hypothetical protein
VQYRTRIFDRNRFPANSGFDATFRFQAPDAAALRGLELAVETPDLYRITLNGNLVRFTGSTRWLDPRLRSAPVEQWVRPGENVLQISGRPFDVRMELENIYLRGNFSVWPSERGFRLGPPARLDFGSWAKQGYPFYGDSVLYESDVEAPAGTDSLRVELPEWTGSVAVVLLDGRQVAVLGWQPYTAQFPASAGKHTVGVRVVSTPRNVFGPFHNPTKPRMRSWPAAWAEFPEHQPEGGRYDLLEYGLMAPAVISAAGRFTDNL